MFITHSSAGVVIATYNGEKYIREQLVSIVNQTVKPDLIVLTDGKSADGTVPIAKEILASCGIPYKLLISENRLSVSENFEKGMSECDSDYVFLSDQDDYWYEKKVEEYKKFFDTHLDCIVVMSDADIVDADLEGKGIRLWEANDFFPEVELMDRNQLMSEMLRRNIFTGMCMAYRNGTFKYEKIKSSNMLHDEAIGWYALFNGYVGLIRKPMVAYRQHSGNMIGCGRRNTFKTIKDMKERIQASTCRKKDRLRDLISIYEGMDVIQLEKAYAFYRERCDVYSLPKFKRLLNLYHLLKQEGYKMYCSEAERARVKDLAYILLK